MTTRLEKQLAASVMEARAKRIRRQMTDQQAIVKHEQQGKMAAAVVVHGDLSNFNDQQLATYYVELCRSLDLNPLTRPFTLLKLNGKLIYYANKDCSDQLRKRDKVSVRIVSRDNVGDLIVVTAEASMPDGRVDQSIGALPIGQLKGEALANALMKAETKAKRRVTLSICGLGMMDESELEGAMSDERQDLHLSPHAAPDEDMNEPARESSEFDALMLKLNEAHKLVFDPGCTWETMTTVRSWFGTRTAPSVLSKRLSELYRGEALAPGQRKELAKVWQSVERKLTTLEAKLKPPSVEASFMDPPDDEADGTEAFSPGEDEP